MPEEAKMALSQLKAKAIEGALAKVEWAKDKSLGDQQAARDQLAAANRMPDDEPKAP